MGYAFLWIALIVTALLFIAWISSLAARLGGFWRFWFGLIEYLIPAAVFGGAAYGAWLIDQAGIWPDWLFMYTASLFGVYIIAGLVVLGKAFVHVEGEPRAAHWSRGKLTLAFCTALAFSITAYAMMDVYGRLGLNMAYAKATDRFQSLAPAAPPDDRNAYLAYFDLQNELEDAPGWLFDVVQPTFDPTAETAVDFLKKTEDIRERIQKAALLESYYQPVRIDELVNTPTPNVETMRKFINLLLLDAKEKAVDGRIETAFQDLKSMDRIADQIWRAGPLMTSAMLGVHLDRIRSQGLEYVLAMGSPMSLRLIPNPGSGSVSRWPDFRRILLNENSAQTQAVSRIRPDSIVGMGDWLDLFAPSVFLSLYRVFLAQGDLISLNRVWEDASGWEGDFHDILNQAQGVSESFEDNRMGFLLKYFLIFDTRYYLAQAGEAEARRSLGDLALAMESWKIAHGSYPDSLDVLTPDFIDGIPMDPFDGQPLKMKPVAGGVDLYSVGPSSDEMIHFYVGRPAYVTFRVEPAAQNRKKNP